MKLATRQLSAWVRLMLVTCITGLTLLTGTASHSSADGGIMRPREYAGSLEELSQEAIIIFHDSDLPGGATEDLILKISVQSSGAVRHFGWVVPFPQQPTVEKEDSKVFKELYDYVQARTRHPHRKNGGGDAKDEPAGVQSAGVEVLSRKIVGSYDVAVVRENDAGALDQWLEKEGFQTLGRDAEDVVGFYRRKGYVFACLKVSDAALVGGTETDLHPLRFTFRTGGCDGVYFPMKMTGLQHERFTVNLYVFYKAWLNDDLSQYGYTRRGFALKYRDWDTPQCRPNAGKAWTAPETDVFLRAMAPTVPTVVKLLQKLHPGEKYYLTNVQAGNLSPRSVRAWVDDLWLFPYYSDPKFVPVDARLGGVAAGAYQER